MITRLKRFNYANIDCKSSILVKGYSEAESVNIGCFGYYLEKDGKKIIVDTGIENIDIVNMTKSSTDDWKRGEDGMCITDNRKGIGVSADEIDDVYLTHSHYDHISGVCHFENARIHISKQEYYYLQLKNNPHNKYLTDVIDFLNRKKLSGKLNLIENEYSNNDVTCKVVGGHTVGSMLVLIEEFLFTGDSIFLLESIEKNLPIGFSNEEENSLHALNLCRKHKGIVLTGHDFECVEEI